MLAQDHNVADKLLTLQERSNERESVSILSHYSSLITCYWSHDRAREQPEGHREGKGNGRSAKPTEQHAHQDT